MSTAPSPAPHPVAATGKSDATADSSAGARTQQAKLGWWRRFLPRRWDWLMLLPASYVLYAAGIYFYAWSAVDAQQRPAPPSGAGSGAGASSTAGQTDAELDRLKSQLALQQDYLDKRAVQLDKRADDLEHLIVEMTVGSGIYTLMLGLFAYFGLRNFKDDARSDLAKITVLLNEFKTGEFAEFKKGLQDSATREMDRARAEFESFRAEVRNDIPELYGMARSLGGILDRIQRQGGDALNITRSWTLRQAYDAMTDEQRQNLLVAEMTIAGLDYFGLPASKRFRTVASEIYVNLANFYAARSRILAPDGTFNQSDMKRAQIYIDRACATDAENPHAHAQRAALTLVDVKKPGESPQKQQLEHAETDLEKALAADATDIRTLYNLAWIARRTGRLPAAIDLLTKIIDLKPSIDRADRGRRIIDAHTNRACYRAISVNPLPRNAATDARIQLAAAQILADCQAACEEAKLFNLKDYCKTGFVREFARKGDLAEIKPLLPAGEVDKIIACL